MIRVLAILLALTTAGFTVQTWRANHWAGEAAALKRDKADLTLALDGCQAQAQAAAQREATSLANLNRLSAGDVSSAFQKGVVVGRAMCYAPAPSNPAPEPAGNVPDGLRDYRRAWEAEAYRPGS